MIKALAERSGRVLLPVFASSAVCNQDTRCLQASTAGGMGKKENPACVIACIEIQHGMAGSISSNVWLLLHVGRPPAVSRGLRPEGWVRK